ncbi:MAG: hypothetical protein E6Q76_05585 [Rhizobium sp.]|nr:MAG: hypothetical protein E6Q76_05585 [Rhizobium sp.]
MKNFLKTISLVALIVVQSSYATDSTNNNGNNKTLPPKVTTIKCNPQNLMTQAQVNVGLAFPTGSSTQNCVTLAPQSQSCNKTYETWGANNTCYGTVPVLAHGSTYTLSSQSTGYTGSADFACNNGVLTMQPNPTCTQVVTPCPQTTVKWSYCGGTAPSLASGSSQTVANTVAGYTGQITETCSQGTAQFSNTSCDQIPATCNAGTINWGNCSASTPSGNQNDTATVTNNAPNYSGTANITCASTGNWQATSSTCTGQTSPCAATGVAWGTGNQCAGQLTSTASGNSQSVTNTAAGYSGIANFTCSNASWTLNGNSCGQNCNASNLSWGTGNTCQGTTTAANAFTSQTINNSSAGYSGSATAYCSNGTWSINGTSCATTACNAQTVSWGGSCTGSLASAAAGGSSTANNTNANYAGSATYVCNGGNWSLQSQSCTVNSNPPANCGAVANQAWGTHCGAPLTDTPSGNHLNVTNTATGYTGSASFLCTNGTWASTPDAGWSCNVQTQPPPCPSQTLNWTDSTTNLTCSGTIVSDSQGKIDSVTDTANSGTAYFQCGTNSTWFIQGNSSNPASPNPTCGANSTANPPATPTSCTNAL